MTQLKPKDILNIIALIRVNFENSYNFKTEEEGKLLIEFWYDSLKDYPKELVYKAVGETIKHSEFAPKIANILNELKTLNSINEKTEIELWAELDDVLYVVHDTAQYLRYPQYYDNAIKKLDKIYISLSDEIKLFVVNVSTLVEIAEMDDESRRFEKTRFLKTMPKLKEHAYNKSQAEQFLKLAGGTDFSLMLNFKEGKKIE